MSSSIRALVTRAKNVPATVEHLNIKDLPSKCTYKASAGECNVKVKVSYSNLNYKDALVTTGTYAGLKTPMVGGIDLVGTVLESKSELVSAGDEIVVNGYGMGTDHFGGYAEVASIRAEWAMKLPKVLTALDAARIGTAGYTAMLCVDSLQRNGVTPDKGQVVVTGATGGVGSIAIMLLSKLGYETAAMTGKESSTGYLKGLGASEVIPRADFEKDPKALASEKYAGCVDTVGGNVLANILSMTKYGGTVAACGLAGGMKLNTTVAPFILRGVQLSGVESALVSMERRTKIYENYAPLLSDKLNLVNDNDQIISLEEVPEISAKILKGDIIGRFVVKPTK